MRRPATIQPHFSLVTSGRMRGTRATVSRWRICRSSGLRVFTPSPFEYLGTVLALTNSRHWSPIYSRLLQYQAAGHDVGLTTPIVTLRSATTGTSGRKHENRMSNNMTSDPSNNNHSTPSTQAGIVASVTTARNVGQNHQEPTEANEYSPTAPTAPTAQTWQQVQRCQGQIRVVSCQGQVPQPGPGNARVRIVGAGICGADVRVVRGDKAAAHDINQAITLGHEGVGMIEAVGPGTSPLAIGELVVVLPHYFPPEHASGCPSREITPECIGNGHTLHSGWEVDGVFGDLVIAPYTHLVRVDPAYVQEAMMHAPHLGAALFAFSEPLLCVLSGYELLARQRQLLERPPISAGRALVIGCGPIGILHGVMLRKYGYRVTFTDQAAHRVEMAQRCLGGGAAYHGEEAFDLVIVAASSATAIRFGESVVADGGTLYLFAGLNTAERSATDSTGMLAYERVHRAARGVWMTLGDGRRILYMGHSGYFEELAPQAVALVAANAETLGRAVTGVIRGWSNPTIEAQSAGVSDWTTPDGSPALLTVLQGLDVRNDHCKLMVCASDGNQQ